jgi:hypothetical protein
MQATISYISSYTNGVATANTTVVVPVTVDPTTSILNLARSGGILFADAANVSTPGILTWVPVEQITKITFA